jgi:hypothetical protein
MFEAFFTHILFGYLDDLRTSDIWMCILCGGLKHE